MKDEELKIICEFCGELAFNKFDVNLDGTINQNDIKDWIDEMAETLVQ